MKQKVVIIGHGFTSRLSVIRSVAQIGCDITVIVMTGYKRWNKKLNTRKPIDCYSKFVNQIFYCYAKDSDGLIRILLDKCTDTLQRVIIIPDSDFSAAVIDDNKELLSSYFIFPHIIHHPSSVRYWMNKENQKLLASMIGLNYAKSHHIEVKNGEYTIPKGIDYPCFTKPVITITGGKQYFKKCDNEQDLRILLDFVGSREDATILAEDYINIQQEYAVLGFSDGKEVVIPGVIQFIENCKSHFGIAKKGLVMPIDGFEPLLEQFKQFVLKMGFIGVFDIDFFYGDGKWWFGEMNLRFGGSGYAVTKMGVNLPAMLVKTLVGENIEDMPKTITGTATYVNERMCFDDWYETYISSRELREMLSTADISFVNDDGDPEPQRMFTKRLRNPKTNIKRIVKNILRRKKQ